MMLANFILFVLAAAGLAYLDMPDGGATLLIGGIWGWLTCLWMVGSGALKAVRKDSYGTE